MQREECHIGAIRLELLDQVGADVDRPYLMAQALERVLDAGARPEGDLALE
jgi:hypothetical protein